MKYQTLIRLLLLGTALTLGILLWSQGSYLTASVQQWQAQRSLYLQLKRYDQLVANSPLDARTWYNRGVLRVQAGELHAALQDFQQALKLAPYDADTLYNVAWVQIVLGKHQAALRNLNRLLEQYPNHLDGRWNRAWLYQQLQQPKQADLDYRWLKQHATQLDVEAQAQLAVHLHQPQKALALYNQILKRNPQHLKALLERARLLLKQNQPEAALQDVQQGLRVKPQAELYQLQAQALLALKRWDEALVAYSQALNLQPSAELYQARADLYLERRQSEQALADYRKALDLSPHQAHLQLKLARLYAQRGQTQEALHALQAALRLKPGLKKEILATREFLSLRRVPEFQQLLKASER